MFTCKCSDFTSSTLKFWAAGGEQCWHLPTGCPGGDADSRAVLTLSPRRIKKTLQLILPSAQAVVTYNMCLQPSGYTSRSGRLFAHMSSVKSLQNQAAAACRGCRKADSPSVGAVPLTRGVGALMHTEKVKKGKKNAVRM